MKEAQNNRRKFLQLSVAGMAIASTSNVTVAADLPNLSKEKEICDENHKESQNSCRKLLDCYVKNRICTCISRRRCNGV